MAGLGQIRNAARQWTILLPEHPGVFSDDAMKLSALPDCKLELSLKYQRFEALRKFQPVGYNL